MSDLHIYTCLCKCIHALYIYRYVVFRSLKTHWKLSVLGLFISSSSYWSGLGDIASFTLLYYIRTHQTRMNKYKQMERLYSYVCHTDTIIWPFKFKIKG